MQHPMVQQALTNVLDTGNRLDQDPVLWSLIQSQLERSLFAELYRLNQLTRSGSMREIKNMAQNLKNSIAALKQQYNPDELNAEIDRANVNSEKIKAFTQELKDANIEVESFLGESGSNFSPSEDSVIRKQSGPDSNGVTINPEAKT